LKGLVPLSGGGVVNFLRADGTWVVPPGSVMDVATLNFYEGNQIAELVVTGIPSVTAASVVSPAIRLEATATHSIDDMIVDPIRVMVRDLIAGVGFTLVGVMDNARANGTYKVNWVLVK